MVNLDSNKLIKCVTLLLIHYLVILFYLFMCSDVFKIFT